MTSRFIRSKEYLHSDLAKIIQRKGDMGRPTLNRERSLSNLFVGVLGIVAKNFLWECINSISPDLCDDVPNCILMIESE
jgi:hypothetical protein